MKSPIWCGTVLSLRVPPPPEWVADLPLIGERLAQLWGQLTSAGVKELAPKLTPYAGALSVWFVSALGSVGEMFVQFLLTVAVAAVMYASGERAAATVIRFGRRLAGDRGEIAVRLAGQAIRSVALGVVVTAVAQSVLGGIGLAVAGVPFASLLTALMFILCLAQIGPGLVLIPAVVWMYYAGDALWATVLLVFTIVAGDDGQFPAAGSDPQGRRSAAAAHPRRRHRRPHRDRPSGYFHRTHGTGGRLYAAECLDGRDRRDRARYAAPMTPMGGISRARSPCRTAA